MRGGNREGIEKSLVDESISFLRNRFRMLRMLPVRFI